MAKGYNKYTEAERARVLVVLATCQSVEETARLTQIPETTIRRWRDGEGINSDVIAHTRDEKRQLANVFWRLAKRMTEIGVDDEKIETGTLPQVTTAIGILTDKALLLEDVITASEIMDGEDASLNARANTQQTSAEGESEAS